MTFEKRILADGRATLYRGDSLELLRAGVFGKLGAIVSDPPYGIRLQESRGGSGSTAIAALSLGHTFVGCEIDPDHFEVACKRVEAFHQGQQPC